MNKPPLRIGVLLLTVSLALPAAVPAQDEGAESSERPKTGTLESPLFSQPKQLVEDTNFASKTQVPAPADVAAPPDGAETTESGLATRVLEPGTGSIHPDLNDLVTLHYTGWLTDGTTFDTTGPDRTRNFRVNATVPGFTEGLMLMVEGEKRRMWIPEELAYAAQPGKPRGMLVFDVELVGMREAPPTPDDVYEVPQDATVTDSGLAFKILREGSGDASPAAQDVVLAHFNVWNTGGVLIDSTEMREKPANFTPETAIPAFEEAFQDMRPGERRRLWIPEELAMKGQVRSRRIQGMLVVDLQLLSFRSKPATPVHLAEPPPDAERTVTGLAYKILRPGDGTRHPAKGDVVEVHYAGWTQDGNLFDWSYKHGTHGTFTLDASMPLGWNEALWMMVEGEKRRVWIPEQLAYGGRPDRPQGMLIFDVELLRVVDRPDDGS